MELQLIRETKKIAELHQEFSNLIKKRVTGSARKLKYSTPGGHGEEHAFSFSYNRVLFWWINTRNSKGPKLYNLFGVNPDFKRTNKILVQNNYQNPFRNFNEASIWAEDTKGNAFLLHSGKMGGGVPGISIETVSDLYQGARANVISNGTEKEFFIVCQINSPRAFEQLSAFLYKIHEIKATLKTINNELKNGGRNNPQKLTLSKYKPEFWGRRKGYFNKDQVEANSDHGAIVDELQKILELDLGYKDKCISNRFVDLGIVKNNKAFAVFEFKTSTASQSIYTAVGQILLHSHNYNSDPLKFLVFPDDLDISIEDDFKAFDIITIRYKWVNSKIKFINLNKIPKC